MTKRQNDIRRRCKACRRVMEGTPEDVLVQVQSAMAGLAALLLTEDSGVATCGNVADLVLLFAEKAEAGLDQDPDAPAVIGAVDQEGQP